MKLRFSMTLFSEMTDEANLFWEVLIEFFGGQQDVRTLEGLGGSFGLLVF